MEPFGGPWQPFGRKLGTPGYSTSPGPCSIRLNIPERKGKCRMCSNPAEQRRCGPPSFGTRSRAGNITKSHVNDAYVMGRFHPKHRSRPVIFQKKRRNNRILEKFYDAKYIDSRDESKKTGQQLFNGRTNRNHNTDTENLRKYRKDKVSRGRRAIRTTRYRI